MKPLRMLRRGSPGQAMVLGAVALLCLSLGVLATLNLGQAVHEKVKLQNTADAAAYSLATLEARTFNYIAFTNRVQISHYHTAMVMQSYLSYAGYALAVFGTFLDGIKALADGLQAGCDQCNVPYLKQIYCTVAGFFKAVPSLLRFPWMLANMIYNIVHEQLGPLKVGNFIEAMSLYNLDAMYKRIQLLKAVQLDIHLVTGMQEFVKRNDKQLEWSDPGNLLPMVVNAGMNSYEYYTAFDKASGMNPSPFGLFTAFQTDLPAYKVDAGDQDVKDAQGIMSEIANATRSHTDISGRTLGNPPNFGLWFVTGTKLGQTRIIGKGSDDLDPKPEIAKIRVNNHYADCGGDRLASDDFLKGGSGTFIWPFPPEAAFIQRGDKIGDGILTAAENSKHFKYTGDGGNSLEGPDRKVNFLPFTPPARPGNSVGNGDDGSHKWAGKPFLAPYFKFQPYPGGNKSASDDDFRTREYNQPSTWMYLHKRPEAFQTTGDNKQPWYQKFSVTGPTRGNWVRTDTSNGWKAEFQAKGGSTASLDTTIGGERTALADFMQGLNVISRGQVYYHRPDDWREQPNFFNPFWRARLAPVAQALLGLFDRMSRGALIPGPGGSVLSQMLGNFLNNALGDFFFRTITQLITH